MSRVNKSRYSSRITLPGTVKVPEEETVKNGPICRIRMGMGRAKIKDHCFPF